MCRVGCVHSLCHNAARAHCLGVMLLARRNTPCKSLHAMQTLDTVALECLTEAQPERKLALTARALAAWRAGELALQHDAAAPLAAEDVVGRPARPHLVPPRDLPRRKLGSPDGRAALLHAVAHIEFNAINLAWDAVYRFRSMPRDYYDDWVGIAADEARHFGMLAERLADCGCSYGDFDAHNGLWDMACQTADSCLARMALVPRVLEARGLDVTPGMIARFRAAGDHCQRGRAGGDSGGGSPARGRRLALVCLVLRAGRLRTRSHVS